MADAYIVAAVRSAGGKKKGRLSRMHPIDLGAAVVDALVEKSGVDVSEIDDLIFGCVSQVGAQSSNVGRNVCLSSVLGEAVPGTSVDISAAPGNRQFTLRHIALNDMRLSDYPDSILRTHTFNT